MLILNSAIYIMARVLPGAMALMTTAMLTHLLDPSRYGLYSLSLIVMTFGSSMAFEWLHVSFLRFNQSGRDEALIMNTAVQLYLAVSGITAGILLIAWLLGLIAGPQAPAYVAGCFLMWTYAWFELAAQFEIGSFRPWAYFIMNSGRAGAIAVAAIGAAWWTRDPIWTAGGTAVGMLTGSLLGRVRGIRVGRKAFDPALARELLIFGLPLAVMYLVRGVVSAGTRALVEWLGSTYALGLYTAAFLLIQNSLAVIGGAVASAGYSMAVRAVESGDAEEARKQLLANGTLLLAVMAPASLGMALTARGFATTVVAPEYVEVVTALTPWMAAGAFFAAIRSHFLDHAFQLSRRTDILIWIGSLAALVSTALTWWLLPRLGPIGAAIAVTVAMAISCVHAWLCRKAGYPLPIPVSPAIRIAAACLVMAMVVLALNGDSPRHFVLQVTLGALAYAGSALLLNVLDSRDRVATWLALWSRRFARE